MNYAALECLAENVSQYLPTDKRLRISYMLDIGDDHNLYLCNEDAIIETIEDVLIVKHRVGPAKSIAWADPNCFKLLADALISAGD